MVDGDPCVGLCEMPMFTLSRRGVQQNHFTGPAWRWGGPKPAPLLQVRLGRGWV